jgi:hypothetical protein
MLIWEEVEIEKHQFGYKLVGKWLGAVVMNGTDFLRIPLLPKPKVRVCSPDKPSLDGFQILELRAVKVSSPKLESMTEIFVLPRGATLPVHHEIRPIPDGDFFK